MYICILCVLVYISVLCVLVYMKLTLPTLPVSAAVMCITISFGLIRISTSDLPVGVL